MSNEAFPWLTGQRISVGAVQCDVLRVNFIGELGYEFHHPIEMQNHLGGSVSACVAIREKLQNMMKEFSPFSNLWLTAT